MKDHNTLNARGQKRPTTPVPETVPHADDKLRRATPRATRKNSTESNVIDPAELLRELRATQAALIKSNERYTELFECAPVGYITLDAKSVIRDVNRVALDLLGFKRNELSGKPFGSILERRQRAIVLRTVKEILTNDMRNMLEVRLRRADGEPCEVRLSGVTRYLTTSGAPAFCIALFDVREEKQRQEALLLNTLIMNHIIEGVVLVRAEDGAILETNPAFERMFGYAPGELTGQHISKINAATTESPREISARIIDNLARTGKWEGEVHNVRKDGSKFWTQAAVTGFVHSTYGPVWVSVQRDITERKRAEQMARERQDELAHVLRLNTVGVLAATLAHEITQPVMAIEHFNHAAIGLAERNGDASGELLQLLRYTDQQVKSAGDVIRQLRKFVRRGVVEKKPVCVAHTIDEALQLLRPMLADHGVEVRAECAVDVPMVNADPVQIEQVLVNLLRNGVEAMATQKRKPRRIDITCVRQDHAIEVIVRDNGPGLDPAHGALLFDVLESKKADGMGMGLAISRSIVQAHGGELWAEPASTGGATFHFTLPVCDQPKGYRA